MFGTLTMAVEVQLSSWTSLKKKKKKPSLLFDNAEETCIHSTAPQSKDDGLLPKVSEAACANANVSFEKWTARKLGVFLVRQCVFLLTQS